MRNLIERISSMIVVIMLILVGFFGMVSILEKDKALRADNLRLSDQISKIATIKHKNGTCPLKYSFCRR